MFKTKFKPFRAFITNQYYENREEYESCGQAQPHTFEEYVRENILELKAKYRLTFRKTDHIL